MKKNPKLNFELRSDGSLVYRNLNSLEIREQLNKGKVETRQCGNVEVRKDDDGKVVGIRGYAAVFNSESEDFGGWRETIDPGTFKADLDAAADVRALVNHDSGRVIGRTKAGTLRLNEDDKGLAFDLDLPDTQEARDLRENISLGNIDGMSFGFITRNAIWEEKEDYDVRHLKDVELLEVSAVAFPAYPATTVGTRSHHEFLDSQKGKASIAMRRRKLDLRNR